MIRIPRPSSPLVFLGVAGALALALLVGHRVSSSPPEVGPLDPVLATPAERLEVVFLNRGQTFGEILQRADVGWSDQNSLLLAFREQANPRRMQDGTRITLRWFPERELAPGRGRDLEQRRDRPPSTGRGGLVIGPGPDSGLGRHTLRFRSHPGPSLERHHREPGSGGDALGGSGPDRGLDGQGLPVAGGLQQAGS